MVKMLLSLCVWLHPVVAWELVFEDAFDHNLRHWVVEQKKGTVTIERGWLEINDGGGATVWYREKLQGPVRIEYDVVMVDEGGEHDRVSDLNCFWMATDPRNPEDLFKEGHGRNGVFKQYHGLKLYYVGFGGNQNQTIRFRRYTGTGERPLKPEHDLPGGNQPNQKVRIRLEADGTRIRYFHGDRLIFDVEDPNPYREGWFGFRTVRNRMRIDNVQIWTREEAEHPLPWKRHVLDRGLAGADGVRMGDVDGDGDQDLVVGWEEAGTVRLYRNPGMSREALTLSWPWIEFKGFHGVEDAQISDVDGDGHPDLVVSQERGGERVTLCWSPGKTASIWDAAAWTRMDLPTTKGRQWMFSQTADVNGDGIMDLIIGGKNRNATVSLFSGTKTPRIPSSWSETAMTTVGWTMSLEVEDMDGDGDPDVVLSDRHPGGDGQGLRWLENAGRDHSPWVSHMIGGKGEEVVLIGMADLHGTQQRDIILPVLDRKQPQDAWHILKRRDAHGLSWKMETHRFPSEAGDAKAMRAADIRGDQTLELIGSFGMAHSPLKGVMGFSWEQGAWVPFDISGPEGEKFDLVQVLDVDGDGDLDVVTTEEDADKNGPGLGLVVFENPEVTE